MLSVDSASRRHSCFRCSLLLFRRDEPDRAFLPGLGWCHQLADGREYFDDRLIVGIDAAFEGCELAGKFSVLREHFAHANEGSHHKYAHLDSTRTVENVGSLNRTVLGERERQIALPPRPGRLFEVAISDLKAASS